MKKTVTEIVELIVSSYNLSTRSVTSDDECVYNSPDGKHCAFAIMVKDTKQLSRLEFKSASTVLSTLGSEILKDEFKGYPSLFYDKVQELHDGSEYWTKTGISEKGREFADDIIERYDIIDVSV